ncbi:hypothetical protein C9374_011170 [Naegleria lovaniensis]|uniref:RXYLT1 C-terminal domain-containing protein n=1 Tax=Naegleria lovaniensis TaxID=51637 RepID=A0AA88KFI1_NAELO|nr:uncharacterized protein C9374_011170 [Naegleria lovaniensis]KAG2374091.1 hypothetical protein C9374_011170 [Naegleria lovaniensis]
MTISSNTTTTTTPQQGYSWSSSPPNFKFWKILVVLAVTFIVCFQLAHNRTKGRPSESSAENYTPMMARSALSVTPTLTPREQELYVTNQLIPTETFSHDGNVCIVTTFTPSCEIETILKLPSSGVISHRILFKKYEGKEPQEMICHKVNETEELKKTNYLILVHKDEGEPIPGYNNNFKHAVLEKLGVLYPHTKVVKWLLGDEQVIVLKKENYENYDFVFRNYWNHALTTLNATLQNIHFFPLFTCYPYVSQSHIPRLPPLIQNNEKLMNSIIEYQYASLVPASKRGKFCYFRGQRRIRSGFLIARMNKILFEENGNQVLKEICDISFTDGFNKGSKVDYSLQMLNSALILCPAGNNPDQFRVWEALENGAIPIPEELESFSGLPKDHPLKIIDISKHPYVNHPDLINLIKHFYENPKKMDEYQKTLYIWWFQYKLECANKMSRALMSND